MPRKITSITIDNYRSWFGPYEPIKLPKGENLLVYGENGSGKSSFFKGMQNFFRSSIDGNPPFELNIFSVLAGNTNGNISIEFSDFANNPATITQYQYTIGGASTNNQQFINDTRKLNSFLDYRHMLGVHYTDPDSTTTPDLFSSFVEVILGSYIIPGTGNSVLSEIRKIESGLKRRSDSWQYDEATTNFPTIQGAVNQIINDVIIDLNRLLNTYFDNNISVQVVEYRFDIDPNYAKRLIKKLKVQVRYANEVVPNYNYFLNEARLSSIAICFYLSAVLSHPPGIDLKILFLDDVFIGLDTSNRMPLLNLLKTEFSNYQIFITTYDRFWYETARDWFERNMKDEWLFREMYVHKKLYMAGRPEIDTTVSIIGGDDLAKALYHLNTHNQPDYPAAANYLRKYAEKILKDYLPPYEIKEKEKDSYGEFPDFISLKQLANETEKFLNKINQNNTLILQLKTHLKRLLNPLSHYNTATPIYRRELDEIVDLLPAINVYLKQLSVEVFKPSLSIHSFLRMKFTVSATDEIFYEIKLNDQLYKYKNLGATVILFSTPPVKSIKTYRITGGVASAPANHVFDYTSIIDAYNQIHLYIVGLPGCAGVIQNPNWVDAFQYRDAAGVWHDLNTLAVWP